MSLTFYLRYNVGLDTCFLLANFKDDTITLFLNPFVSLATFDLCEFTFVIFFYAGAGYDGGRDLSSSKD